MTRLPFWKMCGAGNDFIVVDARHGLPLPAAELATRLCPRRFAVGADGLIAVTVAAPGRIELDFRNADGSLAGFCGNGARCVARFAVLAGLSGAPMTIAFPGVTVHATLEGEDVEIEAPRPHVLEGHLGLAFRGAMLDGQRIVAGVEHVVFHDHPEGRLPLPDVAAALFEARPDLAGQVNITVVRRETADVLRVRTLERGVGETLACGSGALAAALFAAPDPAGASAVTLFPPANVPLVVRLAPAGGPAFLRGEARVVYRGECEL